MIKKMSVYVLMIALILSGIFINAPFSVQAKTKRVALDKKKVVVTVGSRKTVKLKNASRKVQWKILSGKKNIRVVKKSGKYKNIIKLQGKKAGKAVVQAKHGKKTYKIKVTVQQKKVQKPQSPAQGTPTAKPDGATGQIQETKEPEVHLVAQVLNDGLTTDDILQLKYYFDGPTDVVLMRDVGEYKLEIYEEGQWKQLEYREDYLILKRGGLVDFGLETLSWNTPITYNRYDFSKTYKDYRPGHYRYTVRFERHWSYKGVNPYEGKDISVEFDVTYPEYYITAKVKNPKIKNTDNLEITYTVVTESEKAYEYNTRPYCLVQYGDTVHDILPWPNEGEMQGETHTLTGSGSFTITVPVKECFGERPSGMYQYIHEIAGKEIGVIVYIVDDTEKE